MTESRKLQMLGSTYTVITKNSILNRMGKRSGGMSSEKHNSIVRPAVCLLVWKYTGMLKQCTFSLGRNGLETAGTMHEMSM